MDAAPSTGHAPVMLPFLGTPGDVLYYLPALPGARVASTQQLPLAPSNRSLINGTCVEQQLQLSTLLQPNLADQLLIKPISGVVPLACQAQQHNSIMPLPLDASAQRGLFTAAVAQPSAQAERHFLTKTMTTPPLPCDNDAVVEKVTQDRISAYLPQIGPTASAQNHTVPSSQQTYTKRNKMTSQTFLSASYIQTTQVSTDNDHPVSGHLHHLGPVEKAVFQQALYNQQKKQKAGSGQESAETSTLTTQAKCLGLITQNSCSKVPGSCREVAKKTCQNKTEIVQTTDVRRTTHCAEDFNLTHNCESSETKKSSQDSAKHESGTWATAGCDNVIVSARNKDADPAAGGMAVKSVTMPAIRYHPYKTSQGNQRDSSKHSIRPTESQNAATGSHSLSCNASLTTPTVSNDCPQKRCQPAIHVPLLEMPGATGSVHSVSVHKTGGNYELSPPRTKVGEEHVPTQEAGPEKDLVSASAGQTAPDKTPEVQPKLLHCREEQHADFQVKQAEESSRLSAGNAGHVAAEQPDDEEPVSDCSTSTSGATNKNSAEGEAKSRNLPAREVNLPDPLPSYITKIDRPPGRVLKESLHCTTCDVYVNSENQMKQHLNSLRHKNTLQGIPTPPKPGRDEKPKIRAEQYRCNICKVTLNSDIQLSQHLASQRHKNILEGKPPKPRWSPYDRSHPLLRQSALLHLPSKSSLKPTMLSAHQSLPIPANSLTSPLTDFNLLASSALTNQYLTAPSGNAAHLKQASLVVSDAGFVQAREIVYIGAPSLQSLQPGTTFTTSLAGMHGIVHGQQQLHQVLAAPAIGGIDWASSGLRLAS